MHTLEKLGAELCPSNLVKDTPLHVSIRHGHVEFSLALITRMIAQGIGISKVDVENMTDKMTPYFIAVLKA